MVRVIIILINRLINNEQMIQKLADSYPVRRAAQLLVHLCNKNKPTALESKMLTQLGFRLTDKLKKIAEDLQKKSNSLK